MYHNPNLFYPWADIYDEKTARLDIKDARRQHNTLKNMLFDLFAEYQSALNEQVADWGDEDGDWDLAEMCLTEEQDPLWDLQKKVMSLNAIIREHQRRKVSEC